MGVKNLWDILESCKKTLPLNYLQNKRVCIDLSCWMVQLQNVNKAHRAMSDKIYLKGLFHRLRALIALNCSLIFVTDGSIPAIKLATYRQRLNSGSEAGHEEENSQKAQPLRRNKGSEFSRMIKEAKTLGLAMGIPCLDGIEEAEAQCALLNSESLCDGCFTSDSDVFLFGARTVYRDICLGEGGHVVCYEMADIEDKLGFGRKSLITLALLLGCDYSHGVHGLGPESACHFVKSVGDDNVLELIASDGFSFAKKKKCPKGQTQILPCDNVPSFVETRMDTNGKCTNAQRQHQFLQVIDAYLRPKCHSADSDAVYKVLAQHPFQRAELHQICASFFEWPPEKTDGYVLPKVAERELRRFANLRSASSKLGHMPHISQIPAKCPVLEIVKQRKVQGRECFEVLWEGLDGLETCVVPADLIESACPEKIAEFHEKRAVAKKPNHRKPRPKKTETASTVAEVHLDLHSLLLDIESGSDATSDAFLANTHSSQGSMAAEVELESNDGFNDDECSLTAEVEFESNGMVNALLGSSNTCNSATSIDDRGPCIATNEVIDLLSPSPPARPRKVSRCEQDSRKEVDVIDLSDSDTENVSPEHARKARELRMFLAEIKGDLN